MEELFAIAVFLQCETLKQNDAQQKRRSTFYDTSRTREKYAYEYCARLLQRERERQRQRNDDDNTNDVLFAFFEDVVKKELFVVVFVF